MASRSESPVALVTGAGQGLGRVMAEVYRKAGYKVAITGRTASKLKAVNEANQGDMLPLPADLGQSDQVAEVFRQIDEAFGRIDVLINNAGAYPPMLLEQATDEHIAESLGCNLLAPLYCMRAAIPRMRAAGIGDIVNVTSESVRHVAPYQGLYAGGKAAVEAISSAARLELRGSNIRIITLRSGRIAGLDNMPDFNDPHFQRFWKLFADSGYASLMAVGAISPVALAQASLNAVRSSRESTLELIEMRPAPDNFALPF